MRSPWPWYRGEWNSGGDRAAAQLVSVLTLCQAMFLSLHVCCLFNAVINSTITVSPNYRRGKQGSRKVKECNQHRPARTGLDPGGLSPRAQHVAMAAPEVKRPAIALCSASIPGLPVALLHSSVSPSPHLQIEGSTGVITVFLVPCMRSAGLCAYPGVELPLTWPPLSSHPTRPGKEMAAVRMFLRQHFPLRSPARTIQSHRVSRQVLNTQSILLSCNPFS